MKFGIEFVPHKPVGEVVELAKRAEEAGFSHCWITDHYNNRNVYTFLTEVAGSTRRIELGPGVTNPYHIHPALTASAIASIDELSGGRAVLGLSAGDRTVLRSLGIELQRPLAAIAESVEIIRKLLAGERVDFEGRIFRVKGAKLNFNPKREVPIYLGAQGPQMLKLAGRVANGVLVNASHPEDLAQALEGIKLGAREAGRKLEELDVAAYTCFSIAESVEEAEKAARPVVAFIVASCPPEVLEKHGIAPEEARRVKDAIASGRFGDAVASVNRAMLDAFCIRGTPGDCLKRVEEIVRVGITQLVVGSPLGPNPAAAIELIRREIMPGFG